MMHGNRRILRKRNELPNGEKLWAHPEPPRQSLTIHREDTWDAPLKPQRFVQISNKDYVRILDSAYARSRCEHDLVKICCPCGDLTGFRKCTDCQTVFCGDECPALKRRSQTLVEEESNNHTDGIRGRDPYLESDLAKFEKSWIPAEGGMYAPMKTPDDKEILKGTVH